MSMINKELRPCPFCDTQGEHISLEVDDEGYHWYVCYTCDLSKGPYSDEAPDLWNTRPELDKCQRKLGVAEALLRNVLVSAACVCCHPAKRCAVCIAKEYMEESDGHSQKKNME